MDQPTVAMTMVTYRHYSSSNSNSNDSDNAEQEEDKNKTIENVIQMNDDLYFSSPEQQTAAAGSSSSMTMKMTHRGQGGGGGHGGTQSAVGHQVGGGFDLSPAPMSVPSCSSFSSFNSPSSTAPPLLTTILPSGATGSATEAKALPSTTTTTAQGAISSSGIISKILQELDSTFTEDVDFTTEHASVTEAAAVRAAPIMDGQSQPPAAASLTSVFSSTSQLQQQGEEDQEQEHFSCTGDRDGKDDFSDGSSSGDDEEDESMDPLFFLPGEKESVDDDKNADNAGEGGDLLAVLEPRPLLHDFPRHQLPPINENDAAFQLNQPMVVGQQQQQQQQQQSQSHPVAFFNTTSNIDIDSPTSYSGNGDMSPFAAMSMGMNMPTVDNEFVRSTNTTATGEQADNHADHNEGVGTRDEARFREYQAEQWNERFEELRAYTQEHGHCQVSHKCKNYEVLARWSKRQRYQYKLYQDGRPSTMTLERINALRALGFAWNSHEAVWESRMQELLRYKRLNGHCNVPSVHPENQKLSTWCKCQRRQYKLLMAGQKSNMTNERVDRLNAIGFCWEVRPPQHHRGEVKRPPKPPAGFFTSMMPVSRDAMSRRGRTV